MSRKFSAIIRLMFTKALANRTIWEFEKTTESLDSVRSRTRRM